MIFKAIEFAVKAHEGQFRKGTPVPYVFHPLNVAKSLLDYKYPGELAIAGLLHDTIEDTPVTAEDIIKNFNKKIAHLVIGVSEKDKKDTWENRKKETIKKLRSASHDILILSCADKLDNIRSIRKDYRELGEKLWDRFNQPGDKQKWYYTTLAHVFSERIKEFEQFYLAQEFILEVNKVFGKE